jgi:hypothetical protein
VFFNCFGDSITFDIPESTVRARLQHAVSPRFTLGKVVCNET